MRIIRWRPLQALLVAVHNGGHMIWQDVVFAVGAVVFAAALIPTLRDRDARVPLKTSMLTGSVLLIYAATQATLGFWFATLSTAANGLMWLAIAKWRRDRVAEVRNG